LIGLIVINLVTIFLIANRLYVNSKLFSA